MQADEIDKAWIRRAARLEGIEITDEQMPGVAANFRRTVQIAGPVMEMALDEQDELGPVWRP